MDTTTFQENPLNNQGAIPPLIETPVPGHLQDSEYSGHSRPGLDMDASYDRMVYTDRDDIYDLATILELTADMNGRFMQSDRSRLVIRLLADSNITSADLASINTICNRPEIDFYPDSEGRFNYLSIAVNRADRAIDDSDYDLIERNIRERIRTSIGEHGPFESEALSVINSASMSGLRPTTSIGVDELTRIWSTFGWTRSSVQRLLSGDDIRDVVMGIRDRDDQLLAVALYNDQSHNGIRHGETTEWTTSPDFRGRGYIRPLLISLHAYLLSEGVHNIWADLRTPDSRIGTPNSIVPGLRSGMSIFHADGHRYLSSNHVTIDGAPQSYNANSNQYFGNVPRNQLRTFIRGWVDRNNFTPRLIETCVNNLT